MKITVDIDCTPEEARAFLGLPDVKPMQERLMGELGERMAANLKAMEPGRLTARQIEAARRAVTRHMKRTGRVWIRIFPDVPVSTKPAEVRMGSGKGTPEFWMARVKPGRIMFEIDGVTKDVANESLLLAAAKLPIKTRIVTRLGEGS